MVSASQKKSVQRIKPVSGKACGRSCDRRNLAKTDANIDTKDVFQDVLNQNVPSPNDPNAAIGIDRIVAVVNGATSIIDKRSNQTIIRYDDIDFWNFTPASVIQSLSGDPVVLYDDFSQRFFTTIWVTNGFYDDAKLVIRSPQSIAGEYPASAGTNFPAPWNLSGLEIVAADPINADNPLVNASEVAGKLVLVASDNFNVGSSTKGRNVADAGGVGMIIYNTEGNFLQPIFGGPLPSLSIGQDIGEAILAALATSEVVGDIFTLTRQQVGTGAFSQQFLAVSKDSSPDSRDDFYFYEIGDSTGPWLELNGDYPKLGIDGKALYLTTNDVKYPIREDEIFDIVYSVTAVEKSGLLDGTGVNILFFESRPNAADWFLPIPTYAHQPSLSNENEVAYFISPVIDNPTPKGDSSYETEGFVEGQAFKIYVLRNVTSSPTFDSYTVNVKPFRSTWTTDIPERVWNLVKQPPGVFETDDMRLEVLNLPIAMYRAVLRKDQLYFCIHTGDEKLEVRWYQIDVSNIYDATTPLLKLAQEGKISLENETSAFYPSLDVDVDGNMGIGFTISGPNQPVTLAHTGRLKADPIGTLRSPFPTHLSAQPELPFYDPLYDFVEPNILASRWDDYTSTQVDPVDGKMFWYFAEYSNQNLEDYLNFETQRKTALITWSITEGCGEVETRPKLLPQPIRQSSTSSIPASKKNLKLTNSGIQLPNREFWLERIRQYIRSITARGGTPNRKLLKIRF